MRMMITAFVGCSRAPSQQPKPSKVPKSCDRCGMNRTDFAYSRMVVSYTDGSSAGTCSRHCAVEEIEKNRGKRVASPQVADCSSKKLIDAKSATWVVGGK